LLKAPVWVVALATTMGMQTVATFMDQSLPIIAPLMLAGTGLAPERIGNISSINSIGVVLFLLFGGPVLARLGPVRALQAGTLITVGGLVVAVSGWWPILVGAALLMGIGYGPSPPAGSRILAKTAPPQHRTLIFSIKQAGAPAGGALAGAILAPAAAAWGWQAALLISIAVGLAASALISPMRDRLDIEREPNRPIGPAALFNLRTVAAPLRALRANRLILSVTALAFSFAVVQGSLFSFSVTYLTVGRGMSLRDAGFAYACMQFGGVVARILLGWLADRTGRPAVNLTVQAAIAAALVLGFAALPDHPRLGLAAGIAGATGWFGASWNGIYMAEVARLSPPDRIVEMTSSSILFTFLGYVAGPSLFSLLVTLSGGWRVPFAMIAVQLALMAVIQTVILLRRRSL